MFEDIFYPGNPKRRARVAELGADTQDFLKAAKETYATFKDLVNEANKKIAALYERAGLEPPATTQTDILEAQKSLYGFETVDTVIEVSDVLVDAAGASVLVYLAPAATAVLVDSGVISEEIAAVVLVSALGLELTLGAVAGGILAIAVVAVAVVTFEATLDAIEGGREREALREGIEQTFIVRLKTRFSLDRSKAAVETLQSIIRTCDTLAQEDIKLTDELIQNMIKKDADPSIQKINEVTEGYVLYELHRLDDERGSWTAEDPNM